MTAPAPRPRGVFITGTDTGAGKTFAAAALVRAMCKLGVDVGVMKPVASGCRRLRGRLVSEDAEVLLAAAGCPESPEEVTPFRYRAPLGPSVAAQLEKRPFRQKRALAVFRKLSKRHDFMVVEGIGGLAVPLSARLDVADLARALGLPMIIVAADRLGVLNHVMLTADYARRKKLNCLGVVLNRPAPAADTSRRTNAAELKRQGVTVLARLGFCRSVKSAALALGPLARRLAP